MLGTDVIPQPWTGTLPGKASAEPPAFGGQGEPQGMRPRAGDRSRLSPEVDLGDSASGYGARCSGGDQNAQQSGGAAGEGEGLAENDRRP